MNTQLSDSLTLSLTHKITHSHYSSKQDRIHANSRGESIILMHTSDALTLSFLIWSLSVIVKVQLVQAISKGEQNLKRNAVCGRNYVTSFTSSVTYNLLFHFLSLFCSCANIYQAVDEEELQDVEQHSPQRNLQWPQVRVGREQWNEAQGTENVCNGKHCFSN